ncbi:MAG: adenylate/guanylate cyclase domain-containing protein, partial [Anaerolineales bacterium]
MPKFILKQFRKGNRFGTLKAACLFVDLSGFSAMTSELMRIGQYGAEIMAEIMREIFSPMIESVYHHRGFVATFAGDAITALFPIQDDEQQSLLHVIAAAIEIQTYIEMYQPPHTPVGSFSISVRMGVSSGEANWGIISSENQERATYYFRGSAIDACDNCQSLANKGEIVLDSATLSPLSSQLEVMPLADHYLLKGVKSPLPPIEPLENSPFDLENAKRFYPESILTQNPMGEFRHVVNMFISLPTVRTEPQLEIFLKTLFALQDRYGGLLNRIDFGDKGAHMLLFWGAPISYENDIGRALTFILTLQTETSIPINAGITYRIAHAGFIGSPLREEYTCYGEGVNLAARFMTAAPRGEVWVDEPIAHRIEQYYEIESEGEFEFKGFEEKQKVFTVFERRQNVSRSEQSNFIGREKELAQLTKLAHPLAENIPPKPVVVAGEPGIGKSRLIQELLKRTKFPVEEFLFAHCRTDQMLRRSFNPFRYWVKNTFEVLDSNADSRNKRNFNRRIDQLISQTKDPILAAELDRTRSFLGSLVNLFWDDSLYEQLDPQGRYENTIIGLISLLKAESLLQPIVLSIEDLQWIDSDSKLFLQQLYRSINNVETKQYPIFIIATTREPKEGCIGENVPYDLLTLGPLPKDEIHQIAASLLNGVQINPQFGDLLNRYSEGNPLYAEQIVHYLREENHLIETQTGLGIKEEGIAILPADTRALLVARLDQIQPLVKHVVLTAATLGREFHTGILAHMLENDNRLEDELLQAEQ